MNAEEIRATNDPSDSGEAYYLREIAAQLAEHNEKMGRFMFLMENLVNVHTGSINVFTKQG